MTDNDMIRRGDALAEIRKQVGEDKDCDWTRGNNSAIASCSAILRALPTVDVKELVEAATGVMARLVVAFPDVETYSPTVRLAAALAAFEKENGK